MNQKKMQIGLALLGMLLGGWLFLSEDKTDETPTEITSVSNRDQLTFKRRQIPISEVKVGMRVPANNLDPNQKPTEEAIDPDPETWRKLVLSLPKENLGMIDIQMLRPMKWIEERNAKIGGEIFLDLKELRVKGYAKVISVEPCPMIQDGPGEVVISTFVQPPLDNILDVTISNKGGGQETIGSTPIHQFWSPKHKKYLPISEFQEGDLVATRSGSFQTILSIVPRPGPPERVYNLEVNGEHVYFVGLAETNVHNEYPNAPKKKVLSSKNPIRKNIRDAYEEIRLGRGKPRLNPDGTQKVFQARELKRISGSSRNRWEGALEFEVPGTNHRILKRSDGVLGYVENHDYSRIKVFPKPWYPDGY